MRVKRKVLVRREGVGIAGARKKPERRKKEEVLVRIAKKRGRMREKRRFKLRNLRFLEEKRGELAFKRILIIKPILRAKLGVSQVSSTSEIPCL